MIYHYRRAYTPYSSELPPTWTIERALESARRDIEENKAYPISIVDGATTYTHGDILRLTDVDDNGNIIVRMGRTG